MFHNLGEDLRGKSTSNRGTSVSASVNQVAFELECHSAAEENSRTYMVIYKAIVESIQEHKEAAS